MFGDNQSGKKAHCTNPALSSLICKFYKYLLADWDQIFKRYIYYVSKKTRWVSYTMAGQQSLNIIQKTSVPSIMSRVA